MNPMQSDRQFEYPIICMKMMYAILMSLRNLLNMVSYYLLKAREFLSEN